VGARILRRLKQRRKRWRFILDRIAVGQLFIIRDCGTAE